MSKIGKQQLSQEVIDLINEGGPSDGKTTIVINNAIVSDDEPQDTPDGIMWVEI